MSPGLGTLDQHEALRIYYLGITEHLRVRGLCCVV